MQDPGDTEKNRPKIVVILGPTATGKSDLAVCLSLSIAKLSGKHVRETYGGEIISADSRQVYRGLDIATGKITRPEMRGVPHHLLSVVSPRLRGNKQFSVADWQTMTEEKIREIIARGHVPIICGGTGFYIQAIVDDVVLPDVPANLELRKKLATKSAAQLFAMLQKLDPRRAANIDPQNSVRMIRAIEIATTIGKVPVLKKIEIKTTGKTKDKTTGSSSHPYDIMQIGLRAELQILAAKIQKRTAARLKAGMIAEACALHATGLSYARMRQLGLEYRYLADFLQNKISRDELAEKIRTGNLDYTKRQMTWFKRDERIVWFDISKDSYQKKVLAAVKKFLAE